MDNTALELQKITLENQVAQLTKERDSLLESSSRHELQYSKQQEVLNKEIEDLTSRKDLLAESVEILTTTERDLKIRADEVASNISQFELSERDRIAKVVTELESNATKTLSEAETILFRNTAKATELREKEDYLAEVSKTVGQQNLDNQAKEQSLKLREDELNIKSTRIEQEVQHLEVKRENLINSIEELTQIASKVDQRLKTAENRLRDVTVEVISQLSDQKQRNLALTAKEEALDKKERDLSTKELQLEDREATIGRAYQELINKGGQLNG